MVDMEMVKVAMYMVESMEEEVVMDMVEEGVMV